MRFRPILLGIFLVLGLCVFLATTLMVVRQETSASITVEQLVDDINAGRVSTLKFNDEQEIIATLRGDDTAYVIANFRAQSGQEIDTLIGFGADPNAFEDIPLEFQQSGRDLSRIAVLVAAIPLAGILVGLGWVIGRRGGDPRKRKRKNDWA